MYNIYVVASNTERTAIVIAKSKEDAIKTAKKERYLDYPEAYEINEYFKNQIEYAEIDEESEVWIWAEEDETTTNEILFYNTHLLEEIAKKAGIGMYE